MIWPGIVFRIYRHRSRGCHLPRVVGFCLRALCACVCVCVCVCAFVVASASARACLRPLPLRCPAPHVHHCFARVACVASMFSALLCFACSALLCVACSALLWFACCRCFGVLLFCFLGVPVLCFRVLLCPNRQRGHSLSYRIESNL